MESIRLRGCLERFKDAIQKGELRVGFAGGSITTAADSANWPTFVRGWMVHEYPNVRLWFNNAAIGATGSLCGLAMAQREFIDTDCDLVFVEYAVNDHSLSRDERMRTREGLIRKLLENHVDVVLVYTYFSEMYERENTDVLPQSIADFELIAEHYCISSVYMAYPVLRAFEDGVIPWNMWLPDGTHPQSLGGYLYAQEVIRCISAEMQRSDGEKCPKGEHLPEPINAKHWQYAREIKLREVRTYGPWTMERERAFSWFEEKLYTCAPESHIAFDFCGRGISIIFNYGKTTGLIEYRIDGGEWKTYAFERYWWVPEENFVNAVMFADDLECTTHMFELRIAHVSQKDFTSCNCSILKILTV